MKKKTMLDFKENFYSFYFILFFAEIRLQK